jgi:hypothetical protein
MNTGNLAKIQKNIIQRHIGVHSGLLSINEELLERNVAAPV